MGDKNMLTTKENTLISDLLTLEESACKKARLYARTLRPEFSGEILRACKQARTAFFSAF